MIEYPLKYYLNNLENVLQFHILSVGEGLMILIILPGNFTILFDCNLTEDNSEDIISYMNKYIPETINNDRTLSKKINIFINSHRDDDHIRGLKTINENFNIKSIWDSGQTGASTLSSTYQYYMYLRRELIKKYGENSVIVPKASNLPLFNYMNTEIFCLNSSLNNITENNKNYINFNFLLSRFDENKDYIEEAKIQHTNSMVLSVKYAGRSILLTGDSDWKAWKENIVPKFKNFSLMKSDILIASHHGSRSFFTDENQNESIDEENNPDTTYTESINYIKPAITLISCGEYSTAHHPNKDAEKIYKNKNVEEQVYSTYSKGNLLCFIDNKGNWSVIPSRFYPSLNNTSIDFIINCKCTFNNIETNKFSNDNFNIGSALFFSLSSNSGAFEPFNQVKIYWEVSNSGIDEDHEFEQIYFKDDSEPEEKRNFKRVVTYEGKHLLRCRVKNSIKKIDITKIFIVNGIKKI